MAKKKRSWFGWVKKFFNSESKPKTDKKSESWRWVFGRLKLRQCPVLTEPRKTWSETKEEQRKQALNVAMATAAAAEAAVAAAHAAAEVVRLIGTSKSYNRFTERHRNSAAVKIQSAFRAHLARKALRALKGLVKLQAIVRGRAVRRQAKTTLDWLPANAKKQSKVCKNGENNKCFSLKEELAEKGIKPESKGQRSWDCSVISKEDMESMLLRKQEALFKREKMMKYSFSHRERSVEIYAPTQVKLRNMRKHDFHDVLNSPVSVPRRSFSHNNNSNNTFGDDNSPVLNSPVFPTYMAATQSAKAKRSMSTPRQHATFLDTCFDHNQRVPYRNELSLWSSYNGDLPFTRNRNSDDSRRQQQQQLSMSMNRHY